MHELAICQALVAQVEEIAQRHEAQVRAIVLRIGALSGVEAMLLQHAYPLASAGSRSAAAQLLIEPSQVRVRCRRCCGESQALPNRLLCAHCGAWQTDLLSGDEMLLMSVELQPQGAMQ
jgi:hydrogenase nickel incorporation protein HypA/HybF